MITYLSRRVGWICSILLTGLVGASVVRWSTHWLYGEAQVWVWCGIVRGMAHEQIVFVHLRMRALLSLVVRRCRTLSCGVMISNEVEAIGRCNKRGIWSLAVIAISSWTSCCRSSIASVALVLQNSIDSLYEVGSLWYRWARWRRLVGRWLLPMRYRLKLPSFVSLIRGLIFHLRLMSCVVAQQRYPSSHWVRLASWSTKRHVASSTMTHLFTTPVLIHLHNTMTPIDVIIYRILDATEAKATI